MKFSSILACITSFALVSGAAIPPTDTCYLVNNDIDIDTGENSVDEKELKQLNSNYEQNVNCYDAAYDQNRMTLASMGSILKQASANDYVSAMRALASYMRAINAADADGTFRQSFANVSVVYFNSLPQSFKASDRIKRDLEEQSAEAPKKKHRFSKWVKTHTSIVKSKTKTLDGTKKASFKADAKYVRKSSKRFFAILKRNLDKENRDQAYEQYLYENGYSEEQTSLEKFKEVSKIIALSTLTILYVAISLPFVGVVLGVIIIVQWLVYFIMQTIATVFGVKLLNKAQSLLPPII